MQEHSPLRTVAVFCGSRTGDDPVYVAHAQALGRLLAERGLRLVYGGGGRGMMGAVANAHLAAGGHVTGIIPRVLADFEHQHQGLSELIVTADMHERKRMMYERCDAAVILPGGFGTLDELFEMLTWNQLSIHDKRISILDSKGFYTHLVMHMRHLEQTGFLYDRLSDRISLFETPAALVEALAVPRS
ncbi:MAG: TIGR00730 family Rossman fold protein [Chitinophagia bacterium]|nr:TIGR00730 family Rossman fold protein [Chitinophagia bacterium]